MQRLLTLKFVADPMHLKMVREQVRSAVTGTGCGAKFTDDFVIAVNEACMNIMQHAYHGDRSGEIELEINNNGDELVVRLIDYAAPVDPNRIRPRDVAELRPGGLGTHFMREVMDDCIYGHLEGSAGNILQMRKRLERVPE